MKEYDRNWLYTCSQLPTMKQRELEEAESRTNLILQMANNIMDMSARISESKKVASKNMDTIGLHTDLLSKMLDRIQQLESRLILNANVTKQLEDRLEQLEANRGTYYAINKEQIPKMLEQTVKRVDDLESWLYTHDYQHFQQDENKTGNSSFEEYEMHHPDLSYVEQENVP